MSLCILNQISSIEPVDRTNKLLDKKLILVLYFKRVVVLIRTIFSKSPNGHFRHEVKLVFS